MTEKHRRALLEMPGEIWLFGMDGQFDAATEEKVSKYQRRYILAEYCPDCGHAMNKCSECRADLIKVKKDA